MTKKQLKHAQTTLTSINKIITEAIKSDESHDREEIHSVIEAELGDLAEYIRIDHTQDGLVFMIVMDGEEVQMGKWNGKRCYWRKLIVGVLTTFATLVDKEELDEVVAELEGDDEEEELVICPDKSRYTPYVRTVAGNAGRVSLDMGDGVAIDLRHFGSVDEMIGAITGLLDLHDISLPRKSPASSWAQHADIKWGHVNNGQKRMLLGQALRGALQNSYPDSGLHEDYAEIIEQAVADEIVRQEEAEEIYKEEIAEKKKAKLAKEKKEKKDAKKSAKRPLPRKVKA